MVARLTGLEPATPGVTGRYSNQLSYNRPLRIRRSECLAVLWPHLRPVKRVKPLDRKNFSRPGFADQNPDGATYNKGGDGGS